MSVTKILITGIAVVGFVCDMLVYGLRDPSETELNWTG
jgi:hypothetical protein